MNKLKIKDWAGLRKLNWDALLESLDGRRCVDQKVNYPGVGVGVVESANSVYKTRNCNGWQHEFMEAFNKAPDKAFISSCVALSPDDIHCSNAYRISPGRAEPLMSAGPTQ